MAILPTAALELQGNRYTLYLEGALESELESLAIGVEGRVTTGRTLFIGFGRITDHADESSECFPFETVPCAGDQKLTPSLILTPSRLCGMIRGRYTQTDILRAVDRNNQRFIDCLCAAKLDWIDRWKSVEHIRKGSHRRILLPPTLIFAPLTPDIVVPAMGTGELSFV